MRRPDDRPDAVRPSRLALLLDRESNVAEGSALFMAAFLASAALGVVRQVLFNAQFGAGPEASAYYAAFRLPDTLAGLIGAGALSSAMIPTLIAAERHAGPAGAARLVNLVLTTMLVVVGLVLLLAMAGAPWFVQRLLAPGFDAGTSDLTVALTRIMLLQAPIVVFSSAAIALLNSRHRFTLSALSIVAHNLTLIGGILAARAFPAVGIYGPTLGVLGDALLQALILLPGARHAGLRLRAIWAPRDRQLREVLRLLVPNGLSVTVNYAGTIIDTAFASLAREPAGIAAIHNALLLVGLPSRLIGVAVGQAAFPRMAAEAEAGAWPRLRRRLRRTLGLTVGGALMAAAALILAGRPLVRLLFEHGRFDAAAGDLTYATMALYAAGLPAIVATEVLTRGLIGLRDTRTPLATNCLQLTVRVLLTLLTIDQLGVVAVALAFAASSYLEALALGVALYRSIHHKQQGAPHDTDQHL